MPILTTPRGPLCYEVVDAVAPWQRESPPTILFNHGIAADLGLWADWLGPLCSKFRLVRFDLRGFGRSTPASDAAAWSFDALAQDVIDVAAAAGAQRFHFVGESIGGSVGLFLALARPDAVLSVTCCNAAARGGSVRNVGGWGDIAAREGMDGWARQMMRWRFYPDNLDAARYAWFERTHRVSDLGACEHLVRVLQNLDLTARLGQITQPTLLLCPDSSPFVTLDEMRAIHAAIPNSELQVFAHTKHGLPLARAEDCARLLDDFIARRCAAT